MAIRVVPHPATLAWSQFRKVNSLPGAEDAHTDLHFDLAHSRFRHAAGQYTIGDTVLTVSPVIRVLKTATKTADLLAHEQGHYNIGILVGRAMARELEGLSSPNPHTLSSAMDDVFDNHSLTLMPVVQKAYEDATESSHNASEQARWIGLIATALAHPPADKLNDLDL